MSSAKGHEYFLKHYLGTHTNAVAEDLAEDSIHDVAWRPAPERQDGPGGRPELPNGHVGALLRHRVARGHLVREGRPELHRHAQLHPPSGSRGAARRGSRRATGRSSAPSPRSSRSWRNVTSRSRSRTWWRRRWHTTPRPRSRQREVGDWMNGEVEAVPGVTMPDLKVVQRDYADLYNRFCTLGPAVRSGGLGGPRNELRGRRGVRRAGGPPAFRDVERRALPRRSRRMSKSATPSSTWPRSPTGSSPTARTGTWRRRPACRWPIWRRSRARSAPPSPTSRPSPAGCSTARCGPAWTENGRAYAPFTYNVEAPRPLARRSPGGSTSIWITGSTSSSASTCRPTSPSPCRTSTPISSSPAIRARP